MRVGVAYFKGKEGGFFSKLILAVGGGPYSHVELYEPETAVAGVDGVVRHLCFSSYEGDGGVRTKRIHLDERWDLYEIKGDPVRVEEMWKWCHEREGLGYDWLGILGFVMPWRRQDPQMWYCSEICTEALKIVFKEKMRRISSAKISPSQMFEQLKKLGILKGVENF